MHKTTFSGKLYLPVSCQKSATLLLLPRRRRRPWSIRHSLFFVAKGWLALGQSLIMWLKLWNVRSLINMLQRCKCERSKWEDHIFSTCIIIILDSGVPIFPGIWDPFVKMGTPHYGWQFSQDYADSLYDGSYLQVYGDPWCLTKGDSLYGWSFLQECMADLQN